MDLDIAETTTTTDIFGPVEEINDVDLSLVAEEMFHLPTDKMLYSREIKETVKFPYYLATGYKSFNVFVDLLYYI